VAQPPWKTEKTSTRGSLQALNGKKGAKPMARRGKKTIQKEKRTKKEEKKGRKIRDK